MAIKQSEILGLFTSPRDIQALERQRISDEASMYQDPIARQMYMSTAGLARGLGGAFGAQPAGAAEAAQIEKIRKQVPFDVDNQSAYYTQLAQQLINNGLTQAGAQALELAKKARLDEASIRNKEAKQGKLSVNAEKRIGEANDAYTSAIGNFSKAAELAVEFRNNKDSFTAGIGGLIGETWKDIIGDQDEITALRKQALGLFNSQALQSLPPGAASDTDVALALRPFPDANADPEYVARFLDGQAKASLLDAEFNKFKAKYLSDNLGDEGDLIPAWQAYYSTLDLEALFAQHGFTYKPAGQATQQPQSTAVPWSSL